jgi:hypothetical protein
MATSDQPQVDKEDEDRILSGLKPRKSDVGRFSTGRNGDDLLVPFECDQCVCGKIVRAETRGGSEPQELLCDELYKTSYLGRLLEPSKIHGCCKHLQDQGGSGFVCQNGYAGSVREPGTPTSIRSLWLRGRRANGSVFSREGEVLRDPQAMGHHKALQILLLKINQGGSRSKFQLDCAFG